MPGVVSRLAGGAGEPGSRNAVDLELIATAGPDHLCLLGFVVGREQPVHDPVRRRPLHAPLLEVDHVQRPRRLELARLRVSLQRLPVPRRVAEVIEPLPGDVTVRLGQRWTDSNAASSRSSTTILGISQRLAGAGPHPSSPARWSAPSVFADTWLRLASARRTGPSAAGAIIASLSATATDQVFAASEPAESVAESLELYAPLLDRLRTGSPVLDERSALVEQALLVWARPGFETFMCQPRLRFEPFPYQLEAASRVLRHMQGRAILADEVGLGKTIEAGIVLSELRLRGLADRTLILVPAGLVGQWREELERKFRLPCAVADGRFRADASAGAAGGSAEPIVIASLAAARRERLRAEFTGVGWDVVIADEAHRLKNPRSASSRLARELRTRYMLLLTATPIENRLADLFALVSLVRPGLLGGATEFRTRHGAGDGTTVRNVASLQLALRELMVRHRRSEITVMLPRRLAETVRVEPSEQEADLYKAISARVREDARAAAPARLLALRSVQQLAGSSPWACAGALGKLGWDDLAQRASAVPSSAKARALLGLLARHRDRGEKVVVFTAFRRTLEALAHLLATSGIDAAVYHGSLRRTEKDAAITAFAARAPVLLSTEAAGEGRNLQFCHVMVNFDLPWNPMQIEQRLGRIHRIGQLRDVQLTNLVARGTLEERLLEVLQAKINLFELVVGELDMILGRVSDEFDFETLVFQEYVASHDDAEFATRLRGVGDELARARAEYFDTRERVDGLVA